jgi:hypothetical protein
MNSSAMLTLFSLPKAFTGQARIIQDNAIGSWTHLGLGCDIVLLGHDPGVAEAATRHGVRHEPSIVRNEFGTPILADVFTRMNTLARHPIVAFANADIILLGDFLPAVDAVAQSRNKFMIVSSRFNCRIDQPLLFDRGWDTELRRRARAENQMYPAGGSDIFVYPRGLLGEVPPFAIGRGYWDNWLMREARRINADLVDVTAAVTTVHQIHTYDTVAGLPAGSPTDKHVYQTKEGQRNLQLAGGLRRLYTVYDATEVMGADRKLCSSLGASLIRRRLKAWLRRQIQAVFLYCLPASTHRIHSYVIWWGLGWLSDFLCSGWESLARL